MLMNIVKVSTDVLITNKVKWLVKEVYKYYVT